MRPEAPGVWANYIIDPILCHYLELQTWEWVNIIYQIVCHYWELQT